MVKLHFLRPPRWAEDPPEKGLRIPPRLCHGRSKLTNFSRFFALLFCSFFTTSFGEVVVDFWRFGEGFEGLFLESWKSLG